MADTEQEKSRGENILIAKVDIGEVPRYLFKYRGPDDIDAPDDRRFSELIVKNQVLHFANPASFNDPFDCNIVPDPHNTLEEIEGQYLTLFKNVYRHSSPDASDDEINSRALETAKGAALHKFNEEKEISRNKDFEFTQAMFKNFKVSCFSKKDDVILLWSHYAKNHTGMCLKFDILADTEFFLGVKPILYQKKYPIYNIIRTQLKGILETFIYTKAKCWKYEKEWRVVKAENTSSYVFKKTALVEIIFGCKAEDYFINRIKQVAAEAGLNHLVFKKAKVSQTDFSLDFEII